MSMVDEWMERIKIEPSLAQYKVNFKTPKDLFDEELKQGSK